MTQAPTAPGALEAIMEIIVNGEMKSITPMSVTELLGSLDIDPRRVAVELNLDILPKGSYETTLLTEGDRLEIVHFVGGGKKGAKHVTVTG